MNVKLLKKVRAEILKRPTQVNMQEWFGRKRAKRGFPKIEACGTTGCIAGWIFTIGQDYNTIKTAKKEFYQTLSFGDVGERAGVLAEIDNQSDLFFIQYWPEQFQKRLAKAKSPAEYAKVVADRITHFIKTNGDE